MENPFKESEDKLLFAKISDKLHFAQKNGQPTFSDFLDPARCEMFLSYLKKTAPKEMTVSAYGGYENAERKIIGFLSEEENFPITAVAFTYNERFSKPPSHRDYLGAVLGLGIGRAKIGDIKIGESGAVMYTATDIAAFIRENLKQVKRTAVKGEWYNGLQSFEKPGTQKRITVPSLRLDAVAGAAFNISRGKAAALIESEKVYVNWKPAKKTQMINAGETITIRGLGRAVVEEISGTTKKDRIALLIRRN